MIAFITGISGQDGSYLAKFLLDKNYEVVGLTRSYNPKNLERLRFLNVLDKIKIEECDLTDLSQVMGLLRNYSPDEFYNLAAQSSVSLSFKQPIGTILFNINSVLNVLESIRILNLKTKFYQASSSEIFGHNTLPITENSSYNPISPYGISKASAHLIVKNYRESYGLFCCSGILFNHESYLRSSNFFVKKVITESIKIKKGKVDKLKVGNIDIKRDFGWAPEYVKAMNLMMQIDKPSDFIISSGKSVSLREIIEFTFQYLGISKKQLVIDQDLYRPSDIEDIYGDSSKAKKLLGWDYDYSFFDVLEIMINQELENEQ